MHGARSLKGPLRGAPTKFNTLKSHNAQTTTQNFNQDSGPNARPIYVYPTTFDIIQSCVHPHICHRNSELKDAFMNLLQYPRQYLGILSWDAGMDPPLPSSVSSSQRNGFASLYLPH